MKKFSKKNLFAKCAKLGKKIYLSAKEKYSDDCVVILRLVFEGLTRYLNCFFPPSSGIASCVRTAGSGKVM